MPDVGEVRYKAKIDSSSINSDIKTVEKQIDKSGKQIENTSKDTNDKVTQDFQKSSEKSQGFWEKAGDAIAFKVGMSFANIGTAAVAAAGKAIGAAMDVEAAVSSFSAQTGIFDPQEAEEYKAVMEDIYKNNYGEDWQDIADAMSKVKQMMPELKPDQLQETTERAFLLRDVFGYDVAESVRSVQTLMQQFGVDAEEAFSLIATGAQNGLDYSGELLDSINEYSVQFEKLGFSADDMFNIFQAGAENGAFNLDKIGDAIKEFSIRAIDGSDATAEGFELIGLNADEMAAKFAAGGESARDAFFETMEALNALEDPLAQSTAGVDLFGTMWEDLGPEVVSQLSGIREEAYATADQMSALEDVKYDNLNSMMEGLTRSLEMLLLPLGEALIPILSELAESLFPLLEAVLEPISGVLLDVVEALSPLLSALSAVIEQGIQPFINSVQVMGDVISAALSWISEGFEASIKTWTTVLEEITGFIKNVFTGNWSAAWQNIKNIFSSIWEGIKNTIKGGINFIIDGINSFISGVNRVQIPDWVPVVGGKGLNIPLIPRLKRGMPFVPKDMFPAFLDYGERVLTKEENRVYSAALAMNIPPSVLGLLGQRDTLNLSNIPATVYPEIAGTAENKVTRIEVPVSIDGREVARVSAWYMGEQLSWEER